VIVGMTKYLTATDVLVIHAKIIDETGGVHGVRDIGRIEAAVERPKAQFGGRELYPKVFEKAAACFEILAFHHPSIDGNKRAAIANAARFLFINGYELRANNKALEQFVLDAVVEKYEIQRIAKWFPLRVPA